MDAQFRQGADQIVHFAFFKKSLGQGDAGRGFGGQRVGLDNGELNAVRACRYDLRPVATARAVEKFDFIAGGKAQHPADVAGLRAGDLRAGRIHHFRGDEKTPY